MTAHAISSVPLNIVGGIRKVFVGVYNVLESFGRAQAAEHTFRALNNLTDDELARRGMTRDDIAVIVQRILKA